MTSSRRQSAFALATKGLPVRLRYLWTGVKRDQGRGLPPSLIRNYLGLGGRQSVTAVYRHVKPAQDIVDWIEDGHEYASGIEQTDRLKVILPHILALFVVDHQKGA